MCARGYSHDASRVSVVEMAAADFNVGLFSCDQCLAACFCPCLILGATDKVRTHLRKQSGRVVARSLAPVGPRQVPGAVWGLVFPRGTVATHSVMARAHTQMITTSQVAEPCDGAGGPCATYFMMASFGVSACYSVRRDRSHNDVRLAAGMPCAWPSQHNGTSRLVVNGFLRLTFPSSHHHASHSAPSAATCATSTALRAAPLATAALTCVVSRALLARSTLTPR